MTLPANAYDINVTTKSWGYRLSTGRLLQIIKIGHTWTVQLTSAGDILEAPEVLGANLTLFETRTLAADTIRDDVCEVTS